MKKLTKQDVQFIDTYLKNSGVEFIDVRLELLDHIASALEAQLNADENLTFYEAFKNYMVIHKKVMLDDYEKKNANNLNELIIRFAKNFLQPEVFFYLIIAVLLNWLIDFTPYLKTLKFIGLGMTVLTLIVFYFPINKQIHKISLGGKVLSFVILLFYTTFYVKTFGFVFMPAMLLIAHLDIKYFRDFSLKKKSLINGLLTLVILVPYLFLKKNFNLTATLALQTYYQFFTIMVWLVVIKTVYQLKMELYQKYQSLLQTS